MSGSTAPRRVSMGQDGVLLVGHKLARLQAIIGQLRTAKCEVGWLGRRDCFHNSPDRRYEWCWPCTVRWALRADAHKYVAPKDDVIRVKVVRK